MKVGVITFHRALNYGAVLQCHALCSVLGRMGHQVKVIDYRQPTVELAYRPIRTDWLLKKLVRPWTLPAYLKYARQMREKHCRFQRFRDRFFNISSGHSPMSVPDDYDAYVIGSDQMWGQHITAGPDPVYHGIFPRREGSRLIGYAVSATVDSLQRLGRGGLKEAVDRFDAFSFREKPLAECCLELTGQDVPLTIDPTLLADSEVWTPMLDRSFEGRDYVAFYQVRHPMENPGLIRSRARALADSLGVELLDLSANDMEVGESVSAIRYARCVVTSSFHASVFSLIFRRPFYTYMLDDGHDCRYVDLLSEIGLEGALVKKDFVPQEVPEYDFDAAHSRLNELRAASRRFLTDALSN